MEEFVPGALEERIELARSAGRVRKRESEKSGVKRGEEAIREITPKIPLLGTCVLKHMAKETSKRYFSWRGS